VRGLDEDDRTDKKTKKGGTDGGDCADNQTKKVVQIRTIALIMEPY